MTDKKKATEQQIDESRLLPGEELDTPHPDDALHWASVYAELMQFKDKTIENVSAQLPGASDEARHEIETTDMVVLRAERDRFERRARFWKKRYRELSGRS